MSRPLGRASAFWQMMRIVELMQRPHTTTDLATLLGASTKTARTYLAVLRDAGWVARVSDGHVATVRVTPRLPELLRRMGVAT